MGALGLVFGACSGPRMVSYARPYPAAKTQAETVDLQVTRDETEISLTNTTAHSYPASTLWLNRQWSYPLEPLSIGESKTLALKKFRNEYAEKFRAGGFFATERSDRLVQAQLELDDRMVGLVVIAEAPRQQVKTR